MSLILKAARFADTAHAGQFRKYTGQPYICHSMKVAGMTSLLTSVSEEMVAAAWLHDVLEDTNTPPSVLEFEFGPQVARLVEELTFDDRELKARGMNRGQRKILQFEKLRDASRAARNIKILDRIDNLADIPKGEPFLKTYLDESEILFQYLKDTDTDVALLSQLDLFIRRLTNDISQ